MLRGIAIYAHDNCQCGHAYLNQFLDAFIKQYCLASNNALQREVGVSLAQ